MRSRQSVLLDAARHVQAFLDENAALIGPNIASSRRNLDDAVSKLTAMAVTQTGGTLASKGATARQRSLRVSLRNNNMKPIAAVAKLLLHDVPEFAALTMPVKQLGATQLVAAAHGMADAAQIHAATFTGAGLPDSFITDLRTAADAVTTSLDGRQKHTGSSKAATAGLKAQETRLRNLFKLLNALVTPRLGTNVVLLTKWKATKAIVHKAIVPTPAPAPVPAGTPAPAATGTPSGTGSPAATGTPASTPASTTAPASTGTPAAAVTPAGATPASSTAPAAGA